MQQLSRQERRRAMGRLLQREACTVGMLACIYGVSRRTVRKDLASLRQPPYGLAILRESVVRAR